MNVHHPRLQLFSLAAIAASCVLSLGAASRPAHAQACTQDKDCTPSSAAQVSWCHQSQCKSAPRNQPNCRFASGTPRCLADAQCDDARSETVTWCHQEQCLRAPRNSNGICAAQGCSSDLQCNDNDMRTQDWCNRGQCVNAPRNQLACRRSATCTTNQDCSDGSASTVDWCYKGTCARVAKNSNGLCQADTRCDPVEVVLESTRRGAVYRPGFNPGRWKIIAGSYMIRYFRTDNGNFAVTLNYHCFDLSSVSGTIQRAELEMVHSDNSYDSADPFETVSFVPITSVPCDAGLDVGASQIPSFHQALFDDLQSGPELARFQATAADNDGFERFEVNPTGMSALRTLAGGSTPWGIGGNLRETATATSNGVERVFRGTDSTGGILLPQARLILEVTPPGCGS